MNNIVRQTKSHWRSDLRHELWSETNTSICAAALQMCGKWIMCVRTAHCTFMRANKQRDQWELFHIIGIIFYLSKHTYIFVNLVASPMKTTMKKNYSFLKNVLLEAFRESCFVSPCSPIDLCFSGRICVSGALCFQSLVV